MASSLRSYVCAPSPPRGGGGEEGHRAKSPSQGQPSHLRCNALPQKRPEMAVSSMVWPVGSCILIQIVLPSQSRAADASHRNGAEKWHPSEQTFAPFAFGRGGEFTSKVPTTFKTYPNWWTFFVKNDKACYLGGWVALRAYNITPNKDLHII